MHKLLVGLSFSITQVGRLKHHPRNKSHLPRLCSEENCNWQIF